ncbi:MAG: hypothetical protein ABIP79_06470 [Chitinophagaceae bacterium]
MKTENIKRFLSLPVVTIGIILLAIAVRIVLQIHFLDLDNDKSYQIQASKNLLLGHGVSLLQVYAENLFTPTYVPLTMWPPGYSFILSPFLLICKNNYVLATIIVDILTCILFILYSRKILQRLKFQQWIINIYIIFIGFFQYSFCSDSSTDFLTLTLFLIATERFLKIVVHPHFSFKLIICFIFFLFLCVSLRYQYIPVIFCPSLLLIILGKKERNSLFLKNGVYVFVGTAILIITLLFYQYQINGEAVFIPRGEVNFSLNNIKVLHPFLFSAFLNMDFLSIQMMKMTGYSYETVLTIIFVIHFLALLFISFIAIRYIILHGYNTSSLLKKYILLCVSVSTITLLLLLVFSLGYTTISNNKVGIWTYVQEGRYFALPIFFLQQFFLLYIIKNFRRIFIPLIFLILLSFSHDIYYTAKIITKRGGLVKNPNSIRIIDYTAKFIKDIKEEYPENNIVVVSQPVFVGSQAGFYDTVPALYRFMPLSNTVFEINNNLIVIIITDNPESVPSFNVPTFTVKKGAFNGYIYSAVKIAR